MALQQAVGAALAVSTTLPATHDAAGVGALTYISCGKLSSSFDLGGTREIVNFDNLTTGEEEKLADMDRAGDGEISFGFDEADAGQAAIEGAIGDKVIFRTTLKSGVSYHRIGIITSYHPTNVTVGSVVMATVGVAFEKSPIKVPA